MVVQHNLSALFASNQLGQITGQQQKSTEKLSSGYRINRAADDAAGLSISEKMRRQIRGLSRGATNTQDGISFCQVADGALSEVQSMMQRMTELCVQAANGTNSEADRAAINREIQELKVEMNRTFDTTDFNDHKIWNTDPTAREAIPDTEQYVLSNGCCSGSIVVTNDNVGTVSATGTYAVTADEKTITVDWTGLNGKTYQATYPFSDFAKTGTFNLNNTTVLDSSTGKYVAITDDQKISYSYHYDFATNALNSEIASALDGSYLSTGSLYTSLSLNTCDSKVSISSMSIAVGTTYESHMQTSKDADDIKGVDYDAYKTSALTALLNGSTNLTIGSDADHSQWTFTFNSEDHGTLTAKATNLSATSWDTSGTQGIYWYKDSNGTPHRQTVYASNYSNNGIADLLTGTKGLETAGVNGGSISLQFTLYDKDGSSIGSFSLSTSYTKGDNTSDIANRFKNSLTSSSVLTPGDMSMYLSGYTPEHGNYKTIPEYESMLGMNIQTGDTKGDEVDIVYKSLSVATLGLNTLDVTTQENAKSGLAKISNALDVISEQRSTFGAYQNRLEHTYANTTNTVENVTAAESRIRDTDMSDEMMKLATQNILAQAGQSILGQAMDDNDYILSLLQ